MVKFSNMQWGDWVWEEISKNNFIVIFTGFRMRYQ